MKLTKILSLFMALLMVLSMMVSCGTPDDVDEKDTSESMSETEVLADPDTEKETEAPTPDAELEIKINMLNGTTALGMAKMIVDAKNGADSMNYNIELFTAADLITGAIVSGECAIAALPTNAAANLYNKSQGKVKLLALNTLGVLYLLQNGTEVKSFDDLKGKTIYLPGAGSNPEFITAALLEAKGLKVGEDVILDTTSYPSPDALQTALVSNIPGVELAVLPEPKVTLTMMNNSAVGVAMNFTEEWEEVYGENTLVQGCLVVNTKFAEDHPLELAKFLEDYKASVDYVLTGTDEVINTIVEAGILPKAPVAKKALPNCNICYIDGDEMKAAISVFYEKLYEANNASIGAIPDDGFYYTK